MNDNTIAKEDLIDALHTVFTNISDDEVNDVVNKLTNEGVKFVSNAKKPKILVLVESPTKVAKIKGFLEEGHPEDEFEVLASVGHITKIANRGKNNLGIDTETMTPIFINDRSKTKQINAIKKAGKKADLIILASDPDREGEAIAWHLKNLFDGENKNIKRMTFDEITKEAVLDAFDHLREIDMDLVNAAISRQMLDKIIGFLVSGVLQKATGLLSAGRVQTPALKLVVDRDREIKAFEEIKYKRIKVIDESKNIHLDLNKDDEGLLINKPDTYYLVPPKDEEVLDALTEDYNCVDYKGTEFETRSFKPYSTAGLLQDGFTKLRLSAAQVTMSAQKLYEEGLITYIRTDSQRYSDDFIHEAKNYIAKNYKEELFAYPLKPKGKQANTQDAHESIRPTHISDAPWLVDHKLENDLQKRVYNLIWWNTLKSLMHGPSGVNHRWTFDNNGYEFKQSWQEVKNLGYQELSIDKSDENIELDDNDEIVVKNNETAPQLAQDKGFVIKIDPSKIVEEDAKTSPPNMYNQASLIRELKKLGIGRPSTYNPILSKLQDRSYVKYHKGKPIQVERFGYIADDYLYKEFPEEFNLDYTAEMEETLDKIAEGKMEYKPWLKNIYDNLSVKVVEEKEKAVEESDEICPKCHEGHLVFIRSYFNRGRGCSNFPITGCSYREYEQSDGSWKEYVIPEKTDEDDKPKKKTIKKRKTTTKKKKPATKKAK
ncbi:DNA topoisomerase I [Mesoplasma lactucae ATCC 49193]|uniref:DNA topoisomerase 1 n=2 Tax=Mesoplasma lactucae TaxID=138853 RepID=A0A291ISV4_9MOLU|nr:DNA topoisomerase I [Mesoplasma lactucae ATCC 49193]